MLYILYSTEDPFFPTVSSTTSSDSTADGNSTIDEPTASNNMAPTDSTATTETGSKYFEITIAVWVLGSVLLLATTAGVIVVFAAMIRKQRGSEFKLKLHR